MARHALLADEGGGLRRRRREGRNASALALEAHGGRGAAERLTQGGVGDAAERLDAPVDALGARRRRSGAASGADVLDNDCDGGRLRGLLGDLLGRSGLRCGRGGGLGNDCDGLIAPPRLGQGLAEVPADGGGHEPRAALLVAGHPAQALLQGHVGGAPALPAVIGEPPALVRRAPTVRPTAERRRGLLGLGDLHVDLHRRRGCHGLHAHLDLDIHRDVHDQRPPGRLLHGRAGGGRRACRRGAIGAGCLLRSGRLLLGLRHLDAVLPVDVAVAVLDGRVRAGEPLGGSFEADGGEAGRVAVTQERQARGPRGAVDAGLARHRPGDLGLGVVVAACGARQHAAVDAAGELLGGADRLRGHGLCVSALALLCEDGHQVSGKSIAVMGDVVRAAAVSDRDRGWLRSRSSIVTVTVAEGQSGSTATSSTMVRWTMQRLSS